MSERNWRLAKQIEVTAADLAGAIARESNEGTFTDITRVRDIVELKRLVAQLERDIVGSARYSGWSWIRIGEALGITKQAAAQRFGL